MKQTRPSSLKPAPSQVESAIIDKSKFGPVRKEETRQLTAAATPDAIATSGRKFTSASCYMSNKDDDAPEKVDKNALVYDVKVSPPWHLSVLFALQHVSISIAATFAVPLVVAELICVGDRHDARSQIVSTFLVMCGVTGLLQCTLGNRLPHVHGGCSKIIPLVVAMMTLDHLKCPDVTNTDIVLSYNSTDHRNLTTTQPDEIWQIPMRQIQGSLILASVTEILLGATGLVGLLQRLIGPITIMPTISLVGLSLFELAGRLCEPHWGIAMVTVVMILVFSLYLSGVRLPIPFWSPIKKCHVIRYPIFKVLPIILAVGVSWMVSGILTLTGNLTDDPSEPAFKARADAYLPALHTARWFYMPYPCQWGLPTFSLAGYLGMMAVTLASIVESVGNFYTCARAAQLPPPPLHAVNRGILAKGLGALIGGLLGSGGATTTYSQNIGLIAFTKVGSRRVFQITAVIFILGGMCGKLGALLTMMPDPILGGVLMVSLGMITSVGISNLQFVDITSVRNQCIIGIALMLGLAVPHWVKTHPDAINTGYVELDQTARVLLSTSMFIGGILAFLLDNTVPGTDEERGLLKWRQNNDNSSSPTDGTSDTRLTEATAREKLSVYELPYITNYMYRTSIFSYVPISPSFKIGTCGSNERCQECSLNRCGCEKDMV